MMKEKKKFESEQFKLKQKIRSMKVNNLINFAKKISINNIKRDPVDFDPFQGKTDRSESLNGI